MKNFFVMSLKGEIRIILSVLLWAVLLLFPNIRCLGQETLETVTSAGSTTDQRITVGNAIEQDVIGTPSNSFGMSYLSQYAYTTVNGSTQYLGDYMLLRTQGAYWYNGSSGFGFYNRGGYAEPIMEVISGAYGNFGSSLPAHCAIRDNFIYQFIAGTIEYPGTSDHLIADSTSEVLYGITSTRKLYANKGMLIGTTTNDPNSMLQVNGNITAKKLTITQTSWSDFVFDSTYHLPSLSKTETFIKANHHLPGMPSAKEIKNEGLDFGSMEQKQMQKIEELTLYQIEANKRIKELENKNLQLEKEMNGYKQELNNVEKEVEQLKNQTK